MDLKDRVQAPPLFTVLGLASQLKSAVAALDMPIEDAACNSNKRFFKAGARPSMSTNKTMALIKLDCYVTGAPEPRVSWLHDGAKVETDGHRVLMENHTLFIASAAVTDGGEYVCQADNGHSNESVAIHVIMDDVYVPESCTDSPNFANCNLIVRARYCTNKHYSRFCCRSCMLAGQIHANGHGYSNGYANGYANGNGNGYSNGYGNGFTNGNVFGNGYINGYNNGNGYRNVSAYGSTNGNGPKKTNELA
ncbi:hypothetical protein HPB48_020027 [Haemaphysalis longicornis]|uniref:Ig-like domain-containing protein n=1 Tax=Haemaphysalis longicornis TaxID=44386 RepID=A0A9J6GKM7_HAELO|nr:hypothetical protein HPB48_020027 [Haemaphysalis longicornis]